MWNRKKNVDDTALYVKLKPARIKKNKSERCTQVTNKC